MGQRLIVAKCTHPTNLLIEVDIGHCFAGDAFPLVPPGGPLGWLAAVLRCRGATVLR